MAVFPDSDRTNSDALERRFESEFTVHLLENHILSLVHKGLQSIKKRCLCILKQFHSVKVSNHRYYVVK